MNLKQCGICRAVVVLLFIASVSQNASALQINYTSSTNFYVDFSSTPTPMTCDYISCAVTNTDGVNYSNLWITVGSFTNSVMALVGADAGQSALGTITNGQSKPAFFYLQATNSSLPYSDRFTIRVYQGFPTTGTLLVQSNFSVNVTTSGANNANKVNSVSYSPTNNPVVGGITKIIVQGMTGNVQSGNDMAFTAGVFTNWNAGAFELVSCSIVITDAVNIVLTNILDTTSTVHITGTGDPYEADYWVRAVATTQTNTPIGPVSYVNNGGGTINHVQESSLLTLPPVSPATNLTTLSSVTSSVQVYTNTVVTFTLRVTNASIYDVTLDRFVDMLPTGLVYVANSSTFGGVSILNPTNVSQTLTWSQIYTVPAGSSVDFVFQAIPTNTVSSYFTNSCVAYVENSQIDTTLNTSDNAPATEVVRALIAPIAQNVSTNALENRTLTVAAPGVLANTVEPNGFTATIVSFTQPAHGSATVNSDGSYTYTPSAFYWGADSFTFTMTNQNGRASTATNNITVKWVNQPPYFTKGANQSVFENASAQTVANWATAISAGTNDPVQTLTFQVSNNNSNLFSAQPAISSGGTLTYTPAAFASGNATVTVYLMDNGGTANGGTNASASQTFTITVNAVNQPPYFTKGADQTVLENSGAQTVANWATGISSGTNDPVQTLTFQVSNNNSNLFSMQPAISSSGTLTYTPAANAFGSATVSVYLTDNGGTANGGNNTSPTQNFVINVTAVNQPPTINPISNLNLVENWNLQTVNFSGVTAGPTNESSQTLTITATSSNPSLVPNPTVNYTSPNSTGSLMFTPATNSSGSATITVVVKDNGGTANGGIDSVTNTFDVTLQALTNYWFGGSNLTVNVSDATGAGGVSQTNYLGVLSVPATTVNPFTIKLVGLASNFNYSSNYTWTIATTTRGVLGLTSTNQFIVDTSAFTNDLAGGYFQVVLSNDGGSVDLVYVGNQGPAANPVLLVRALNTSMKISIANILTNYTSDPNGDVRILTAVGVSTNGSSIYTNGGFIFYAPTNNLPENFIYVVRDGRTYRPGDTVLTATNWISISVNHAVGYPQSITPSGGTVSVLFAGVPGYAYDVQRSTNLTTWIILYTTNAPRNGFWIFTDSNPPQPSAYYRAQQH